jgi:hypothetical protein
MAIISNFIDEETGAQKDPIIFPMSPAADRTGTLT